jgi:hypothetical protein
MTPEERVLAAFEFQKPDRIPVMDGFWSFPPEWEARFGDPGLLSDIGLFVPHEGAFPLHARSVKEEDGWSYAWDQWGRLVRRRAGAYFSEAIRCPWEGDPDLRSTSFDPPSLDCRYYDGRTKEQFDAFIAERQRQCCLFVKTGGPFLRTSFMRGETQFLMDMASDPCFAGELAALVGRHITAVGVESLQRTNLLRTGIWIFDDLACNQGPMFSPAHFERVLLPAYRSMIAGYRRAGAKYVIFHSDGDIRPLLDMLIDAGIDGINPVERRAGMRMTELRRKFPNLILTGGMCNSDTLINGPISRIEDEAREIIDLGRDGGVVIGSHSISPEVPMEHYSAYRSTCLEYGRFSA